MTNCAKRDSHALSLPPLPYFCHLPSVISQYEARIRLNKVAEHCRKVVRTRQKASGVDGASAQPQLKTPLAVATDFVTTNCTWKQVFDAPVGVLPLPPGREAEVRPWSMCSNEVCVVYVL